jgi:hypothetical protein
VGVSGKDVILEIGVGLEIWLDTLDDETSVGQLTDSSYLGLLLDFAADILFEELHDGALWMSVLALHLSFRGLPGGLCGIPVSAFHDEEPGGLVGAIELVDEAGGTEIDSPALFGVLDIEVQLVRGIGETFGSTEKARLENVKDVICLNTMSHGSTG